MRCNQRVAGEPGAEQACSYVALRRMFFVNMTGNMTTLHEEVRTAAALVYRDVGCPDRWLVCAPEYAPPQEQAFTGPNAWQAALEFAHRRYGSARSLLT